jgi:hypothetical protein
MANSEVIALVVAGLSGAVAVGNTVYTQRVARKVREQEQRREEAASLKTLLSRYRDPLLRAAFDLQSKIYNIVAKDFFLKYHDSERADERAYARDNTLYVIAEYLGWVEILRRKVRFLDLGDDEKTKALEQHLDAVSRALFDDREPDPPMRVFRGQQRAIGELMICDGDDDDAETLGYATFSKRLREPGFFQWFEALADDIDLLAREPKLHDARLRTLQGALIDLIDCLGRERLLEQDLQKLPTAPAPARV